MAAAVVQKYKIVCLKPHFMNLYIVIKVSTDDFKFCNRIMQNRKNDTKVWLLGNIYLPLSYSAIHDNGCKVIK